MGEGNYYEEKGEISTFFGDSRATHGTFLNKHTSNATLPLQEAVLCVSRTVTTQGKVNYLFLVRKLEIVKEQNFQIYVKKKKKNPEAQDIPFTG